jgi:chromosome segregation ATPase
MADPNLTRQIRSVEDMVRSITRNNDSLRQQVKLLERQLGDVRRMPNSGREESRIRDQIRAANEAQDRGKQDIRTLERQLGDLKRMAR